MIDPKDIIKNLTVDELCVTADDYFKSITDPTHQMAKPFSSLLEAPEMLQNMGHLLSGLRLGKTMTVLEFGAGTCWFSRFLNQLQCQTISCDVSRTALEIGQRLFEEHPIVGCPVSAPRFLHFDGHKIDLPDESVDRILCNDAFHHVPNQEEALSELSRVLKKGGIAGFNEGGKHHSRLPQSQYEMKHHNVLENDTNLTEIFAIAKKHGFDDIKIKLLCDDEVSLSQYDALTNNERDSDLDRLVNRNVHTVMNHKTIFFLYKGRYRPDSRGSTGLAHTTRAAKDSFDVPVDEDFQLRLTIANTGGAVWLSDNLNDIGIVRIGTHLYDKDGKLLDLDFSRHPFEGPVAPGERLDKTITLRFPDAGVYQLCVDLVSEGICWFENLGSKPCPVTLHVG